ncbi:MAG: hypothetical protein IK066_08790 [Kiritimatiellae bacterium]|nr:hypothetical protein [Kiritimatiellia bacterium]
MNPDPSPTLPERPSSSDAPRVALRPTVLPTCMDDRTPCVRISCCPVEDPAVFRVGPSEFYLRADWGNWYPISDGEPDHLRAIAASRRCTVVQFARGGFRKFDAPVYFVPDLPDHLFPIDGDDDGEEGLGFDADGDPLRDRRDVLDKLPRRLEECDLLSGVKDERDFPPGRESADYVVASQARAALFAVMPPEFDGLRQDEGVGPADVERAVKAFLARMKRLRRCARNALPSADLHFALLEHSALAEWLFIGHMEAFKAARVELHRIDEFQEYIRRLFP